MLHTRVSRFWRGMRYGRGFIPGVEGEEAVKTEENHQTNRLQSMANYRLPSMATTGRSNYRKVTSGTLVAIAGKSKRDIVHSDPG